MSFFRAICLSAFLFITACGGGSEAPSNTNNVQAAVWENTSWDNMNWQ